MSSIAQLSFDFEECDRDISRYHAPSRRDPYVAWCWRPELERRFRQRTAPVSRLAWLIRQIPQRPGWQEEHHYIAQGTFSKPNRRAVNLWSLGLLWADIDLESADHDRATADYWTRRLLQSCEEHGLPTPSLIVWSGRGLYAKLCLDAALPAAALPRWAALMRSWYDKLKAAGWPVDNGARDVSRVLRIAGTYNPKLDIAGKMVLRPVWVTFEGPTYSIEQLTEWLLPYSREEVAAYKRDRAALEAAAAVWRSWDENRRRAQACTRRTFAAAELAAVEAAQTLWHHRLTALRSIAAARGGIAPGQRNDWVWVLANAVAWGLADAAQLWHELVEVTRECVPTYTEAEVRSSASSVWRRLRENGRDGLYRLRTSTIAEQLGLTDAETKLLRAGQGHARGREGLLGFDKMKGLDFDAYIAETRRRQAAGGRHTAQVLRQKNAELRAHAQELRARGLSVRAISHALGVGKSTVADWLDWLR